MRSNKLILESGKERKKYKKKEKEELFPFKERFHQQEILPRIKKPQQSPME